MLSRTAGLIRILRWRGPLVGVRKSFLGGQRTVSIAASRFCIKDNIFDEQYWIERIAAKDYRWHQEEVHQKLLEYRDFLFFKSCPKVFIPLCGKTKDMKWFYDQGCHVVGVDCSSLALQEFFEENDMKFSIKELKDARLFSSEDGRISLYACNLFSFRDVSDEKAFEVIWDRGSFVAINTSERQQYVDLMKSLVAPDFRYLLDTYEYDPAEYGGPPKTISDEDLEGLFAGRFKMKTVSKVECDMSKYDLDYGETRTTILTPLPSAGM